jgi:hypothetical protein
MKRPDNIINRLLFVPATILGVCALGCGDDSASADDEDTADSAFTDSQGSDTTNDTSSTTGDGGPGPNSSAGDDGDPDPPGDGVELCDAGDEAFVKRLIPFVQGRKPDGMREVRLLVQMIEQLDAMGEDGRRIVARGLADGELYVDRWKTYLYERMRVNRTGDRRNVVCYDTTTPMASTEDLAVHIRDNPADVPFAAQWYIGDAIESALRLDDITPAYRADLFARMSAPIIAGNVTIEELEIMNRANYGQTFETTFLGRKTECLPCHRSEFSVTYSAIDSSNRHWPIPGHFELAVYGPEAEAADEVPYHAIFRHAGMMGGPNLAWNMRYECGTFAFEPTGDLLGYAPYMAGDFAQEAPPTGVGANVYHLDARLQGGFERLRARGLVRGDDLEIADQPVAMAYLIAMNIANEAWEEATGHRLVVANNFPRNQHQRDILQQLTEAFVNEGFSLSALIAEVATHDYFNQAPPDSCNASSPYHLAAVFDPFTRSSSDPNTRLNGVGDSIHRFSPFVLIDSVSHAMWWDRAQRFGPYQGQIPDVNCGAGMFPPCDEGPVNVDFLRDVGVFLNDSESGFNGVDFNGLLHWEEELAQGIDPGLGGDCTGPLGSACASSDWIVALIDVADATPGTLMADVAVAIKDRLIAEPMLQGAAEEAVLETLMGASLHDTVADVGAAAAEAAARRLAGALMNTPQFLLAGVSSRDQDPAEDPILVVPGTSTAALCAYVAPLVLDNTRDGHVFEYSCTSDGVELVP